MEKNKEVVKEQLKICDDKGINPWEYNFINEYIKVECKQQDSNYRLLNKYNISSINFTLFPSNESHIRKFLQYKSYKFGSNSHCDRAVFPIYSILSWQENKNSIIRGDTMNSFWRVYSKALKICIPKDTIKKIYEDDKKYREQKNMKTCTYDKWPTLVSIEYILINFDNIHRNIDKEILCLLEKYAKLVFTIGNFTVLPYWMNSGRNNSFQDYWDLTLKYIQETLEPLGAWKNYVDKFYMYPFLDKDLTYKFFWDREGESINEPQNINELKEYLINVIECIGIRGRLIIKVLRNELQEY